MVAALRQGRLLLPCQGNAVPCWAEPDPFVFQRVERCGPLLRLAQQDRYRSKDVIEEGAPHLLCEHIGVPAQQRFLTSTNPRRAVRFAPARLLSGDPIAVAVARYDRGGKQRSTPLAHMKT